MKVFERANTQLVEAVGAALERCEGVTLGQVMSASRRRRIADARHRAMAVYYALNEGGTLDATGRVFARGHCTTLFALRKVRDLCEYDWDFRERFARLKDTTIAEYNKLQKQDDLMIRVTITGTLGRDAEVKAINGKEYYKLNVGVRGRSKDAPTTWVDVLYYAGGRDALGNYLLTGAGVAAAGRGEVSTYTNRDGEAAAKLSVWADALDITKYAERKAESAAVQSVAEDNDLPF